MVLIDPSCVGCGPEKVARHGLSPLSIEHHSLADLRLGYLGPPELTKVYPRVSEAPLILGPPSWAGVGWGFSLPGLAPASPCQCPTVKRC